MQGNTPSRAKRRLALPKSVAWSPALSPTEQRNPRSQRLDQMPLPAGIRLMPLHPIEFAIFTFLMVGFLTLICYIKGEPPRWRWGD